MPKYLAEGRYTADGLRGLAREGASRRGADIAKMIESVGGKLEALYFAFGDADFYIIGDVSRQYFCCRSVSGRERKWLCNE